MTAFILRFVTAGLLVATLPIVANQFGDRVAGLILLCPVVTLTGLVVLGLDRGIESVARTSLASLIGVPTVLVFLLTVHFCARQRLAPPLFFGMGLLAWLVSAVIIVSIMQHSEE